MLEKHLLFVAAIINSRYIHRIIVLMMVVFLCANFVASADDAQYRSAMAKAVRTAAEHVLPSIVTVEVVGTTGANQGEVEQDAPTSGVVVDDSGFIIASSIVVRRPAASILVVMPDRERYAAEVIARDYHRDLVLLKIDPKQPLQPIRLDQTNRVRVGQTTVAVGRYGSEVTPLISVGVLSATDRLDGIALQTDARISPAFYGAPLIDLSGSILGLLIPAVAEGGAPDATSWYDSGIAFAIPTDIIRQKLDRLKSGQDIKKGLIGIVAKAKDPYENDTEVAAVRTRSPAEAAGLKPGDKILSVAGEPVRRHQEIKQVLGRFDAGESIAIKFKRDDATKKVEIVLTDSIPPLQPQRLGVIANETPGEDDESSSVIVQAVVPESPADGLLKRGDIIRKFADSEIKDIQSLRRQLISAEPDKAVAVSFVRDGDDRRVSVIPESISGRAPKKLPSSWESEPDESWTVSKLKLPDAGNEAATVAPGGEEDAEESGQDELGLLILLLNPGQGSPNDVLKTWTETAPKLGVVVCAIAAEDTKRWQPREIDVVTRMAASAMKRFRIEKNAVAVAAPGVLEGGKAEASDSMALAVALSAGQTFFGVAVSDQTRAPAVRLRENQATQSLQVLLPISDPRDLPPWGTALQKSGYPIVLGDKIDQETLLRWTRLLQAI